MLLHTIVCFLMCITWFSLSCIRFLSLCNLLSMLFQCKIINKSTETKMKIELNDTCVYRRTANDNVMILIGHYVKVFGMDLFSTISILSVHPTFHWIDNAFNFNGMTWLYAFTAFQCSLFHEEYIRWRHLRHSNSRVLSSKFGNAITFQCWFHPIYQKLNSISMKISLIFFYFSRTYF